MKGSGMRGKSRFTPRKSNAEKVSKVRKIFIFWKPFLIQLRLKQSRAEEPVPVVLRATVHFMAWRKYCVTF